MSDDSADVVAMHAGDPPPRWPTLVCDGWITPNHPRFVICASAPGAGISFGMCPICAASMSAAAERARGGADRAIRHAVKGPAQLAKRV